MKYCHKPIVIDAVQWFKFGDHSAVAPIPDLAVPSYDPCPSCRKTMTCHGWIKTLEGEYKVCPGDWVIKDKDGNYSVCKADVFEETYEVLAYRITYPTLQRMLPKFRI